MSATAITGATAMHTETNPHVDHETGLPYCNLCQDDITNGQGVQRHRRGGLVHAECVTERHADLRAAAANRANNATARQELRRKADDLMTFYGVVFPYSANTEA